MIALLVGDLVILLAGHAVLRLGGRRWPHRTFGLLGALGLCWLAGVATLGVLTTLVAVLGGPTRPLPLIAPLLGLLAAAGIIPDRRQGAGATGRRDRPAARIVQLGDLVCGLIAAGVAARTAAVAASIPVASNDEYAMWLIRARTLSQLGTLDPRVFTDTGAAYQHQNYPLFFPSLIAWGDGWVGRPSDAAAHVAVAAILAALLATTGWAIGRLAGPLAAVAAVALVASMPTVLSRQSLLLMADVPVFAFGLALALVLLLWLRHPGRALLAAAAMLGAGAVGTKVEGALFAGSTFFAALLLARGHRRGPVVVAAVAALANLPWLVYSQVHHVRNWIANRDTLNPRHIRDVLPFTGHVLHGVVDRWPGAGGGVGIVLALSVIPAAVLAMCNGGKRAVAFIAVVVALDALVLIAQYVVSANGPAADPTAGQLLDSQLRVTVYRIALVPASLLMIATPLLAGLGVARRDDQPADPDPPRAVPAGRGTQYSLARRPTSAETRQDVSSTARDH